MADDDQYDMDGDQYEEEQDIDDDALISGEQKRDLERELLRFHPEALQGHHQGWRLPGPRGECLSPRPGLGEHH